MIAEGHTNKHIARLLNISLKTVETHRATERHAQSQPFLGATPSATTSWRH